MFPGDTLFSESEVLAVRPSRSDDSRGVVTVETRGYNQSGKVVIRYGRSVMVWRRGRGPTTTRFPDIAPTP